MQNRQPAPNPGGRIVPALLLAGGSWAAWNYFGGEGIVSWDGSIRLVPALAAAGMGLAGLVLLADLSPRVVRLCGYIKARRTTGLKGDARWVKSIREVRKALIPYGYSLFWGTFRGAPVLADIESSAAVIGPSGSGKTTKFILPSILALSGKRSGHSKVIFDFKSDMTPQLATRLRKNGERLQILNIGGLYEDRLGQASACHNPLTLICDTFFEKDGLLDVTDIVRELCCVLDRDEKSGDGDNASFWKNANRRIIGFVILVVVLIEGRNATLGLCLQMLNDRESLIRHAGWVAGRLKIDGEAEPARMPIEESPWASRHDPQDVINFTEFMRGLASGIADMLGTPDSRMADGILAGAQQALAGFDITTRAHRVTSRTTFRFSELKDKGQVTTACIMLDSTKIAAQEPVLAVLNWCCMTELKRHPRKDAPVYIFADEIANIPWRDLQGDLTWARAYGVRLIFAFQNFPSFAHRHGDAALECLLSEAQIKLFMPQQRNPKTNSMLETMLSSTSVMVRNSNANRHSGAFTMEGYGLHEDGKPLMNAEEIRRTEKGILFLGNHRPMQVDLPSIAEIHPWRKQLDPHPFTGKRYLKRVKLRIKPYSRPLLSWIAAGIKYLFTLGRDA